MPNDTLGLVYIVITNIRVQNFETVVSVSSPTPPVFVSSDRIVFPPGVSAIRKR